MTNPNKDCQTKHLIMWLFTLLTLVHSSVAESSEDIDPDIENQKLAGANYLQNVMNKLHNERELGQAVEVLQLTNILNMDRVSQPTPLEQVRKPVITGIITGPTPNPPEEQPYFSPPSPSLTSNELSAIYNAAITKDTAPLSIAQYHQPSHEDQVIQPASQGQSLSAPGYYYYFYPIKSFLQPNQNPISQPLIKPAPIQAAITMTDATTNKSMEPLFMAVTGFIGMALMFIASVLFLPKFGNLRSDEYAAAELKHAPDELAAFGRLVVETLDGKDCTDRIACEVGRAVREMKLDKMFKVLEIILPPNLARQIGLIRKAAAKKEKCNFIPCVFKTSRPPVSPQPLHPSGPSPHDLWMKHFEKTKNKKKDGIRIKTISNKYSAIKAD